MSSLAILRARLDQMLILLLYEMISQNTTLFCRITNLKYPYSFSYITGYAALRSMKEGETPFTIGVSQMSINNR